MEMTRLESEEHAQNGVRREHVPDSTGGAHRTLCALRNTLGVPVLSITYKIDICTVLSQVPGQTKRVPPYLDTQHAGAELLRNTRKTECGASMFPTPLVVRTAPFAPAPSAERGDGGGP